jgi:translocation and assembly module TamB
MKKPSDYGQKKLNYPHQSSATNSAKKLSRRQKLLLGIGIVLLTGLGGGLTGGWFLIQRKLIPLVETELTDYFHRPVHIGRLESLLLTGARFGESTIPATDSNPDTVSVKAVQVNFNPLKFLWQRTLNLNLTLIKPNIYLEQEERGIWTPTDFGSGEKSQEGLQVNVDTIRIKQGDITLVAWNKETQQLNPAVKGTIKTAKVRILNDGELVKFKVGAKLNQGGNFTVNGEAIPDTKDIDLAIAGKELAATEIDNLLSLPLEVDSGKIDGDLQVKLSKNPLPYLKGTASLQQATVQIPGLVKPFSQSEGKLHFEGSEITFDDVSTFFGEITGVVNGSLDTEGDYNISAQTKPAQINQVIEALELDKPAIPIEGKIEGNVQITGASINPITKFAITTVTPSRIDKLDFKNIKTNLELINTDLLVRDFAAIPRAGGVIQGTGQIELEGEQNLFFDVQAKDISAKALAKSYNTELTVDLGLISGQAKLLARAGNLESLRILNGSASFPLGGGTVTLNNFKSGGGNWQTDLQAKEVKFGSLPIGKNSAPTIAAGKLDGQFTVNGKNNSLDLQQIKATGKGNLKTVGGQVNIPKVALLNGRWLANLDTAKLQLKQLFPELPEEFEGLISGEFNLTGEVPTKPTEKEKIDGVGNLTLAEGTVAVSDFQVRGNDWNAKIKANDLRLDKLNSGTPSQFAGLVNGDLFVEGNVDNIVPEAIRARGEGTLTLPEGVFTASNLAIAQGKFETLVIPEGVDLSLFADPASDDLELKGQLEGQLQVRGNIDRITPTALTAKGQVFFSEGIDLLEQPFTAAVTWNGKRLNVLQATGETLNAQGFIELDKSFFEDIPDKLAAVEQFQFAVAEAQWINIQKLRLTLPSWATNLDYSGRADFQGQIGGIPSAMEINGGLTLRDFVVENLTFTPMLQGKVIVNPQQGVNLELAQETERIELVLDKEFLPISFLLEHNDISVTGKGKGELLEITTANFPVDLLKTIALKSDDFTVPENLAVQTISGELSGNFIFNLNTLATSGENVEIISPVFGRIKGDRFTGNFQYADNYFALQQGRWQQRNSIYQVEGSISQKPDDLALKGEVKVEQGQIQDVLVALEIFELSDLGKGWSDRNYATAEDLYVPLSEEYRPPKPLFKIGSANTPIIDQLYRLAEIEILLNRQRQNGQENSFLPELVNLQGNFDGSLVVGGSLTEGIEATFNFEGQNWHWDTFTANRIQLAGNFKDNILTLLPIVISSDTSVIAFSGSFGGETQSGQLRLIDVPFELIEKFVSLPPEVNFGGLINTTATIAGSKDNPQARGEISLADATLNQTSVESTQGSFSYNNARFNFFASSVVAEGAEPLTITGSIPYQLPFATVKPDSDRLNLSLNVRNEGLAFLNILSRGEINWIKGEGDVTLDISGIFDQENNLPRKLVAEGKATINNGTLAARSLPDAWLSGVQGNIYFNFDRIAVESFQGNFGGGKVFATGTIPLTKTTPQPNPLTIALDNLAIDLKGFYEGGIKGQLQILGSAVEPDITGELSLFDGTILLGDTTTSNDDALTAINNGDGGIAAATEYKNLQLELGNNIQISQPPISNFVATGKLNVGGTFNLPRPEGEIILKRGQINLFTTQLSLARGNKNIARFSRNSELDPYLDVNLVGSALETSRSPIPNDPLSSEISDIPASSFGTLETVRISARVKGLASELGELTNNDNNVKLTSSPPRTQTEILALLGGSFVDTLGRGDSTLGLANLAGSALFGSFNTVLSDAFGLSEFRLFPTQIIDENRERERIIGLAGEVALDLTDNVSFSVLKILNTDIPAQFGFRYRLNENFVFRGSTNFDDDTRTAIEYELRF